MSRFEHPVRISKRISMRISMSSVSLSISLSISMSMSIEHPVRVSGLGFTAHLVMRVGVSSMCLSECLCGCVSECLCVCLSLNVSVYVCL